MLSYMFFRLLFRWKDDKAKQTKPIFIIHNTLFIKLKKLLLLLIQLLREGRKASLLEKHVAARDCCGCPTWHLCRSLVTKYKTLRRE